MKTSISLKSKILIALFGAALAASVFAQPGPGMGRGMGGGMGGGPGMQNAGPGAGGGTGGGPGRPGGRRGMRFNQDNTQGWALMTPEERTAHREKMRSVKTVEECKALQVEHRSAMEERAKGKGITLPTPRQNGCDRMKARGFIK